MPHKDFDVPEVAPDQDPDPITFTLAGRKMRAVPVLSFSARLIVAAPAVYKRDYPVFVRGCLVPEDEALFDATLADKSRPVQIGHVEDVFWYLIEAYTEREGEAILERKTEPKGE